jgi:hypothetical protein
MKDNILHNWNFMRVLRLLIGLAIMVQAVAARDLLFGLAGLLFSGMAVFNMACCGMGGCPTNYTANNTKVVTKDISYEEVGNK